MMEICRDPIQPERGKEASIELLYERLNAISKALAAKQDARERKELARECVSLCRTAIGVFAWERDSGSILKVVNYFNRYLQIIVDAGDYRSTEEFNILTYGPNLEGRDQVEAEKERLKRDFLSKLCLEPEDEAPKMQILKYARAAFFQGLQSVKDYYLEHYGK